MKTGDIVTVHDGSWCLIYPGTGELRHASGITLIGREWQIMATDIRGPIHDGDRAASVNDTMLAEVGCPGVILFTQLRFCAFVRNEHNPKPASVSVPVGTKTVVIEFV